MLPAIVSGLKNSDAVVQHETFAPILYVMPYDTLDEAIDMQNGVPGPVVLDLHPEPEDCRKFLSAAVNALRHRQHQHRHVRCGDRQVPSVAKDTGGGRESVRMRGRSMRRQTNTINYSDSLPRWGIKFDL